MDGLLVIDKPAGMTSRDVVNIVQRWYPRGTKIGHTGTLDPLATGVLVLCIGKATRLADKVQAMPKRYRAGILLGATSDTDDLDGVITPRTIANPPPLAAVCKVLSGFVGSIEQRPPAYCALKVGGRRAYDLARRGRSVPLSSRTVRIDSIEILNYDWPHLEIDVACGKGTYIRSLARDLGENLGVGGLIETLRRTGVGPFRAEDGLKIPADKEEAKARIVSIANLTAIPDVS